MKCANVTELTADHLSLIHPTVIVIDDMISTGTTMLRAIYSLQAKEITEIYFVVTHGLFLDDNYEELKHITKGVIVSDTINHGSAVPLVDALLSEKIIPHW